MHLPWATDVDAQWRAGLDVWDDRLAELRHRIAELESIVTEPDPQELFDALIADVHTEDPDAVADPNPNDK